MVAEAGDRVEVVARHEDGAGAAHSEFLSHVAISFTYC